MKLYHEVRGCSLAVDIVARELDIPLQLEWVNMTTKRLQDGSDYHRINSKGTVPTLALPDGTFLTESAVIMQFLADGKPERGLLARAGTMQRYRTLEWNSFVGADLHKGCFMPLFKAITPPEYKQIARQYLNGKLAWLDQQLEGKTFLTGPGFTIADAHCYVIAMWTRAHAVDTSGWPRLEAFLARVGARPSVVAAERAAAEQGERDRIAREHAAAAGRAQP